MDKSDNKIRAYLDITLQEISQPAQDLLFNMILLNNQKIPKNLLEKVLITHNDLSDLFGELLRFGLVEQISKDRENQIFRIHDAVKTELLNIAKNKLNQQNINQLIHGFSSYVPEAINKRLAVIKSSSFLESNLEVLLNNVDTYNANIYQIMALREKLLWYYLIGQRQSNNAKKMVDWFEENNKNIGLWFATNEEKASYSTYLTFIGMYKCTVENKPINSVIPLLDKAEQIAQTLPTEYGELKSYIYSIKALTQITVGDIIEAKKNVQKAEQARPDNLKTFLGVGLVEYNKSKILIAEGKYQEALKMLLIDIDKLYSPVDKASKNIFLASEYLVQVTILNHIGKFEEAYDIVKNKIYENIRNKKKGDISIVTLSRTLTELSRAELGIGKKQEALDHAIEAVNILIEDKNRENKEDDLDNSKDIFLANALLTKADALSATGNPEEAMITYRLVKNIYWNIYGIKNIGSMDNASYLFSQAAKAAKTLQDQTEGRIQCSYFYRMLLKYFGVDHPRTREIYTLCN